MYKTPADRLALWEAVQDERFFLGSDSAPHDEGRKLSRCGCAGVWSAPVLPQVLAHLFGRAGLLHLLPDFVRHRAEWFHLGTRWATEPILLRLEPYRVPDQIEGMEPIMSGDILDWTLAE